MTLEGLFDYALTTLRTERRAALLDLADVVGAECLVHLSLLGGRLDLRVAAHSVDTSRPGASGSQERYPITGPTPERDRCTFYFWAYD